MLHGILWCMQNQFGNCDSVRYPAIWWMTSVRIGINSQLSSILRTFSSDLKTENLTEYSGIPYRLFWDFRADNTFTTSWSSCRVTSARVQVWVTVTIFKAWAVIAVNNNSTDMGISGRLVAVGLWPVVQISLPSFQT